MKKILTSVIFLLFVFTLFAQTETNEISIAAGPSMHGTGDFKGFMVSITYEHELAKRFSLSNGLTTTINYGRDQVPGLSPQNRLMNFTTAGIQWNASGNYHLIAQHDTKLSAWAGAMLRFQSSSFPSVYSCTQDQRIYPEPFYVIYDNKKQNTLSPGYSFGLSFKSRVAPKYFLGIGAGFQNDTNGDAITFVSLSLQRVLPKFR